MAGAPAAVLNCETYSSNFVKYRLRKHKSLVQKIHKILYDFFNLSYIWTKQYYATEYI